MYEELNKKLAEWLGWEFLPDGYWRVYPGASGWGTPSSLPSFTESLDTCFKWLVPKAIDEIMAMHKCSSDIAYRLLFKWWVEELELNMEKPALALCLAIEKPIEKEEEGKE